MSLSASAVEKTNHCPKRKGQRRKVGHQELTERFRQAALMPGLDVLDSVVWKLASLQFWEVCFKIEVNLR